MIEPEVLDRLCNLAIGVVAVSFGLGLLLIIGSVIGSILRLRRLSRDPSTVSKKVSH